MMKIKTSKILSIILVFVLTVSVLTLTGCFEEEPKDEPKNIVETATEHNDFNTLVDALTAANLVSVLSDEDAEFTVFAPTDAAFSKLGNAYVTDLVENDVANLTKILQYHVLDGKVMAADLSDGMQAETILGKYIDISIEDDTVYVNDAKVTTTDIECSNGIIHVIDTVLEPKKNIVETAIEYNFDTLVEAVIAAELDETLSDETAEYTVFAPTDEAFNELNSTYLNNLINNDTANLTSILTYHVLPSIVYSSDLSDNMTVATVEGSEITVSINNSRVYVDDAMVSIADIQCSNGVIHVINKVLLP